MIIDYFSELSNSNYWAGQNIALGVSRKEYINLISGYIGNKLIKVLSGQRGSGKSFLLKQLVNHLLNGGVSAKNILYINKTFTETLLLLEKKELMDLVALYHDKLKPVGKVYIFIEEIQNINDWYQLVVALSQDSSITYELFLSCSNQIIDSQLDVSLLKTMINFNVSPFSYEEYQAVLGIENNRKGYVDFISNGYLYSKEPLTREEKNGKLSLLKNNILYKDIIQKNKIKDAFLLENVFLFLAQHISELVSINNIVPYLKEKGDRKSVV